MKITSAGRRRCPAALQQGSPAGVSGSQGVIGIWCGRAGAYPPSGRSSGCPFCSVRQKKCHRYAITPGGQRKAPGCGEICRFHFGNHMADSAGRDGLFNGPESLAAMAGHDRKALQPARCCCPQGRFRHEAQILRDVRLTDPQQYTARGRPGGRQCKAGGRSPVSISSLRNLMQPAHAEPIGKGNSCCRNAPDRPDQAFGFEGRKVHMFLFCSFPLLSISVVAKVRGMISDAPPRQEYVVLCQQRRMRLRKMADILTI